MVADSQYNRRLGIVLAIAQLLLTAVGLIYLAMQPPAIGPY